MRNIGQSRSSITDNAYKILVHALMTSCMAYSNVLLHGFQQLFCKTVQFVSFAVLENMSTLHLCSSVCIGCHFVSARPTKCFSMCIPRWLVWHYLAQLLNRRHPNRHLRASFLCLLSVLAAHGDLRFVVAAVASMRTAMKTLSLYKTL